LEPTSISIYNASAGSGKTFTLVKEYLKTILQSSNDGYYRHLLAITFTNKAVAEMKERLVQTLKKFSEEESISEPPIIMLKISEESGLSIEEIHFRSKNILQHLLHNYAAFSVETIDKFNHRLIRTFARDLKLVQNFEVSLEADLLLEEAVDSLLSKTGQNKRVTDIILDFALQKTDDDKSWDVSRDIARASKLLFLENEADHVSLLKEKSLEDFSEFKKQLLHKKRIFETSLKAEAQTCIRTLQENGVERTDISGGYLWDYFEKLSESRRNVAYGSAWQNTLGEKPLYPKRVSSHTAAIIDELTPSLINHFKETKNLFFKLSVIENILKNITPLSVINLVNQELDVIKTDRNLLPISEFNSLINQEIKNQPAPFIYERLGEKYRHFFIDEFQDTSKLQWENLIPLIDNALAQDNNDIRGSLLLVGDAKQSIYRWRGGLPEQFMGLYHKENPFPASTKQVLSLGTNFRSCEEVIDFNNQFFTFLSSYFATTAHQELYKNDNNQCFNNKKEGYVKLEFIEKDNKTISTETYSEKVFQSIEEVLALNYSPKDICILTRKKSQGVAIGSYLMERGIHVISSETLLVQSSPIVQLLMLAYKLSLFPENEEAKIFMLDGLHDHLQIDEEKHTFFSKFLGTSELKFSRTLREYGVDFRLDKIRSLSVYESFEYIIDHFNLSPVADAYLFGFMDLAFEFGLKPMADKMAFLEYWDIKKDKASIPASEGTDAVQLMTIHKSKGLEFPVVIFPFADIKLYESRYDTLWYPLEEGEFNFNKALINFKSEVENYSAIGEQMYLQHRSQMELDNINLLYVTLTRAVDKLYIFSEQPTDSKKEAPQSYNQLFMEFLKMKEIWNSEQVVYEFGTNTEKRIEPKVKIDQIEPKFFSSSPEDHSLHLVAADSYLIESGLEEAIFSGNILHDTMAKINTAKDAENVLNLLEERSIIPKEDFQVLKFNVEKLLSHTELKAFYDGEDKVYVERDIITASGRIIRPDRINIHKNGTATILDYKTGNPQASHQEQLSVYENAVLEMGYQVAQTILIYFEKENLVLWKSRRSGI
jgi:ATP-dependent exoDNAse (exonuclease V) beta subunit